MAAARKPVRPFEGASLSGQPVPGTTRVVATAVLATAMGAMPVFLLGGLAVQVRADLGMTEAQLGFAVTVFFAVSALGSTPAGRVVERIGIARALATTAALTALGLVSMSMATSWAALLAALAVGALGNAFAQPAANLSLARGTGRARQGLVFGVKQSAVPLTSLLGGAAVPVVALTVGWRWAFVAATVGAAVLVAVSPRDGRGRRRRPVASTRRHPLTGTQRPLVVLACAGFFGNVAANSLGIFLVETAVQRGTGEANAGALLVLGSACGIAARLVAGWYADVRGRAYLPAASAMLVLGAVGFLGLASARGPALVGATVLAFAFGWGWNGLFTYAVVDAYRTAPAAATGLSQTGLYVGAMTGPGLFGVTVQLLGFHVAWTAAAASAMLAAASMLVGHRMIARQQASGSVPAPDEAARPPAGDRGEPSSPPTRRSS